MNEQQGKHLDQRVRQALGNLPDVPAPGSGFDAGKLWEQLRPELATQPAVVPERMGQVRWLIAASLIGIGLFLNWLLLMQPDTEETQTGRLVTRHMTKKVLAQPQQRTRPEQKLLAFPLKTKRRIAEKQTVSRDKELVDSSVQDTGSDDVQPVVATNNVPADLPITETTPAPIESASTVTTRKAAPLYPKRRFAVVHQNELRAEAETRDKLERNDRFVRLGRATPAGASPAEEKPGLIIPLN